LSLGWSSENPSKNISIHDTSIVKTHPAAPTKNMTLSARNARRIRVSSTFVGCYATDRCLPSLGDIGRVCVERDEGLAYTPAVSASVVAVTATCL